MTNSANIVVPHLADGIPSLNIEPIDPIDLFDFEGKVGDLLYKLEKSVVKGYSKCRINDVKLNLDAHTLNFNIECPSLYVTGHLVISGPLGKVTVEGNDNYKITCGKYFVDIETNIEKVKGNDGEMHMAIKLKNVVGQPKEPMNIDYNFMYKGNLLSESDKQEKLLEATAMLTPPFLDQLFKQIFNTVNKHLESIPFDNLFLD
ncbi:uncharacterized protein [Battus philenor]|uniref:uncharacterized protein n=1 Tax=Battus philenor TaxID=42288 RepID=UPI0035CECF1C